MCEPSGNQQDSNAGGDREAEHGSFTGHETVSTNSRPDEVTATADSTEVWQARIGSNCALIIPNELSDLMGLKVGDPVRMTRRGGQIVLGFGDKESEWVSPESFDLGASGWSAQLATSEWIPVDRRISDDPSLADDVANDIDYQIDEEKVRDVKARGDARRAREKQLMDAYTECFSSSDYCAAPTEGTASQSHPGAEEIRTVVDTSTPDEGSAT